MDPPSVKRRLTCILAADAVGYSQQMEHDEEGTIRVLAAHRAVIDGIIVFHGGRIISTAGDSVLAEFSSAVEAVRAAVEIQEALKTRNDALPDIRKMQFRVGVNLGDVVVNNNDLLGDGVNVAARLETIAEPGGICISSSVYDQITGKLDLGFLDIGEQALKNISRPIRVYRVSGAGVPHRPEPPAPPPKHARSSFPWAMAAAGVVVIAGIVAWQAGWLQFGTADRSSKMAASAPVLPPVPATPPPPSEADAKRLQADVDELKKEAEAARTRSDADAVRTAKTKADAEAAASRIRTQAQTDAARIRREAETDGARAKGADAVAATTSAVAGKAAPPAASAATVNTQFDGAWSVAVACESQPGVLGYKFDFVAQVKDGFLTGERRSEGNPGWLKLQGSIQPDGGATLDAHGLTDDPKYSANGVAHGTPYAYHVAARFDATHGTGRRLEMRVCDLRFAKQ